MRKIASCFFALFVRRGSRTSVDPFRSTPTVKLLRRNNVKNQTAGPGIELESLRIPADTLNEIDLNEMESMFFLKIVLYHC